ncbi:hypothetical protein QR90_05060 [Deinococcus radiopugnans]|uniref:Uncharacterized protein n=1 Tax=Deinococcus radiopugnans TaxID=57497 RepID=A0A0A7KEM3_9DEIO|nr:hypothetical protein [Deinococcus radiopugnans]AIZ44596.1 hypothetical protein QR90_05060 [Deinococcus radiopugnans]
MDASTLERLERLARLLDLHVRWRLPFSASLEQLAMIPGGQWPHAALHLSRLALMLERRGILLRVERDRARFSVAPLPLPRAPVHLEWAAWHHRRLRALVGEENPRLVRSVDRQVWLLVPPWSPHTGEALAHLFPGEGTPAQLAARRQAEGMASSPHSLPLYLRHLSFHRRGTALSEATLHLRALGGHLFLATGEIVSLLCVEAVLVMLTPAWPWPEWGHPDLWEDGEWEVGPGDGLKA